MSNATGIEIYLGYGPTGGRSEKRPVWADPTPHKGQSAVRRNQPHPTRCGRQHTAVGRGCRCRRRARQSDRALPPWQRAARRRWSVGGATCCCCLCPRSPPVAARRDASGSGSCQGAHAGVPRACRIVPPTRPRRASAPPLAAGDVRSVHWRSAATSPAARLRPPPCLLLPLRLPLRLLCSRSRFAGLFAC